jgi:hypothetical protein
MQNGDRLIYDMRDGVMTRTNAKITTTPNHRNFVIICGYGDWSGFCTLGECERRFPELEKNHSLNPMRVYKVVER